jgi:hypothetical protein
MANIDSTWDGEVFKEKPRSIRGGSMVLFSVFEQEALDLINGD